MSIRGDGTAAYVAAGISNQIRSFAIDPVTLVLTPLTTTVDAGFPLAVAVDPAGKFLYTAETSIEVRPLATDGTVGAALGNTPAGGQCSALSFAPGGLTLFGHCFGGGAVVPIDPTTGAMSARTSGGFGTSRNAAWIIR